MFDDIYTAKMFDDIYTFKMLDDIYTAKMFDDIYTTKMFDDIYTAKTFDDQNVWNRCTGKAWREFEGENWACTPHINKYNQ